MLTNTGVVNAGAAGVTGTIPVGANGSYSIATGVGAIGAYGANGPYGIGPAGNSGTLTAADIIVDGKSITKSLKAINERLNILEPKKELLEQYEALKQAYEHYKTLEALLYESNK